MTDALTYLDYNATAPLRPEAADAMVQAMRQTGNPSSVHRFGRLTRRIVEDARDNVASLVGARAQQVVFTGGGTEANNLALNGVVRGGGVGHLIVSAIEHDSVLSCAGTVSVLAGYAPCTASGVIDVPALETLLHERTERGRALISVLLANNETGVVQPIEEVVSVAREYGALVHCDAVQAAGKMPVSFHDLGVDLMSISAHKMGGPQGVGALIVADAAPLAPILTGGGQEQRRRAGTENVAGIAGFGSAAELAAEGLDNMAGLGAIRDRLESAVKDMVPEAVIYGQDETRLPTTSSFGVDGLSAETQVMALDLAGIAVSAGSACSSGKVASSHVLQAMGANEEAARSAIRVSLGWASQESDIDKFVAAWGEFYRRKRQTADVRSA